MESNFNISTKVNRVSMPTQNKVDTVMKNLGHRPCVAYSEEKDMYYKDGEWVASDLDATILPLREMFEKTSDLKLRKIFPSFSTIPTIGSQFSLTSFCLSSGFSSNSSRSLADLK